jgi:hypothetical protein
MDWDAEAARCARRIAAAWPGERGVCWWHAGGCLILHGPGSGADVAGELFERLFDAGCTPLGSGSDRRSWCVLVRADDSGRI